MSGQPLVIANWKMNGNRQLVSEMAEALREQQQLTADVNVVVCPPTILLPALADACYYDAVAVGAQDVSQHAEGAFTGETSVNMLREAAVEYVLVGHSERRQMHHETDAVVADKLQAVTSSGLKAVLCVGENAEQRESEQTFAVIKQQLQQALSGLTATQLSHTIVAYEPVWAIGTGLTASPQQAEQVHQFIRQLLTELNTNVGEQMQILYGGSVKADNAEQLFAQPSIDGGLIGGASLKPDAFIAICQAARGK
ncbi:triose-phosphate isomerase [Idiomarina tyrosinivorans]|uniref:Triosephosphate isomerase n=1 Tax=Idiomarina tyrosinivorans TaxID=1445662 RepID=A0A432ZRE9_9GAMM|nr:triose-phosphate isomerase [Idiomarina tyrosinivorans]RUO80432.1 triose-phosphate isomerase [Idiomarina tyrosinivorans]